MKKLLLFAMLFIPARGADWYVSTNGTGNGTLGNPWFLQAAFTNSSAIQPGDTVWLRGGTYFPTVTNATLGDLGWAPLFAGATNNPITIRSYTNEWAAIDRRWTCNAWIRFRDLEFFDSKKGLYSTNGVANGGHGPWVHFIGSTQVGNEWINCLIHDIHNGFSFVYGSETMRGCIVWYVGWNLYEHVFYPNPFSASGNVFIWPHNKVFNNSPDVTLGGWDGRITVSSNVVFGGGVPFNSTTANDLNAQKWSSVNVTGNWFQNTNANVTISSTNSTVSSNLMIATQPFILGGSNNTANANTVFANTTQGKPTVYYAAASSGWFSVDHNAYYDITNQVSFAINGVYGKHFGDWQALGFDPNGTTNYPTHPPNMVTVIPNADQVKRGHVGVFNPGGSNTITADLSSFLTAGDNYSLYSAQNYQAGAIQTGVYSGPITVPLTNLTAAPILYGTNTNYEGETPVRPTLPSPLYFGAFVVTATAGNTTWNLTVSSAPNSGGLVTASPIDNNGFTSGTTSFSLNYNNGVSVTLTAPAQIANSNFSKWTTNSVDAGTSTNLTFTVTTNLTAIAIYKSFGTALSGVSGGGISAQ